jgi:Pex2 / Pex12 amino terminal region
MDSIADSSPSFYEIVMQDRLNDMLWQAIKFLVSNVVNKVPQLVSLRYYIEEISSMLCSLIDIYYLYYTKGTFTENFYSLRRDINRNTSIFMYIFVHYWAPLVVKMPVLNKLYDVLKGLCMGMFLYFKFPYFSPEFFILQQKLIRCKDKYSMSYRLIALIIAGKCMELYFNSKKKQNTPTPTISIDPPYSSSSIEKGQCGICKQNWINPTALITSGYIFCYTCIKTHVQVFSSCPITSLKSTQNSLRKLHIN